MATAHINIGSNIGDRKANIGLAVASIEREFGYTAICSDFIESEPWGYDSRNKFLNLGLNIEIGRRDADEVMRTLLELQSRIDSSPHRDDKGGYADRAIDIDLIAIDDMVTDTPSVILPHPRMHERLFVLEPMAQIWPEWKHPVIGLLPKDLISRM